MKRGRKGEVYEGLKVNREIQMINAKEFDVMYK